MQLIDHIEKHGELIEYAKGELVFRQGETNAYLYFIREGLLKAYYITSCGKKYIKTFVSENDFIGSISAYQLQKCTYSLLCLEPSRLLRLKFTEMDGIINQDHEAAISMINMLIRVLTKKERREFEFLCFSAEERYKVIKEQSPDLLNRVTQNDIAQYLGITPVALSRIGARIKKE